jgi:hypothetical protein
MSEKKHEYKFNGKILNSILCDIKNVRNDFRAIKVERDETSDEPESYLITSPTGTEMTLIDGQEVVLNGNKLWRMEVDPNKNIIMTNIVKSNISNLSRQDDGSFLINTPTSNDGLNVYLPEYKNSIAHIGEEILVQGTDRTYHLEMGDNNEPVAVAKGNTFTVITGNNVNAELWAKGGRGEFSVYGASGLVGHFTTNMTPTREKGKNGVPYHICEVDKEHNNLVVNMGGNEVSVPLKVKELEYQIMIYKDIVKRGFLCHFNVIKPGDKSNNNKNGIEGILYPAKDNQPIKFVEKAADGEYYNTASFFPASEKSATGVLRDINDAMYMANLSRKPKKITESIKEKGLRIREIEGEFKLLEINPLEDQEYTSLLDEVKVLNQELSDFNSYYTKDKLKELNTQTWSNSNHYVLWKAESLVKTKESANNYNSGYNN